jgi:hypothetical protein
MPRAALVAIVGILLIVQDATGARAADMAGRRAALYASYAKRLDELTHWCREQKLDDAVSEIGGWLPPREADQSTLFLIPPDRTAPGTSDPPAADSWRTRWQKLRNEQADALLRLAREALNDAAAGVACELVTEAVRENPDQQQARRILGYVNDHGAWRTPFDARQLAANKVWHDQFGWIPKSHVERYQRGQRYYQGRWIIAEEESRLRSDLKRGWRIESEHYLITTNHSQQEGVRLSQRLEALYAIWQQVFAAYPYGEAELARRFDGRSSRRDARQHNVVYYRTREQYNDALRDAQPQIEITLGIYFDKTRTAYFFAGEDQQASTLYHEATHQLFHETRPVAAEVGRDANFWVVEGIACYMESLAEQGSWYTLGGMNAGRMPAARHRLLQDDFYEPLEQFVQFGMPRLQRDPRIARLYSQASGLADFFMHDKQGRYRDALVRYLDAVYSDRATTQTLSQLCGTSYATLDSQYRQFMAGDEKPRAATQSAAR